MEGALTKNQVDRLVVSAPTSKPNEPVVKISTNQKIPVPDKRQTRTKEQHTRQTSNRVKAV